jgi:hypothetical protein
MEIETVAASELAKSDVIRVPDEFCELDYPEWWEIWMFFIEGKDGDVVLDVESVDGRYNDQWRLYQTDRVERQVKAT